MSLNQIAREEVFANMSVRTINTYANVITVCMTETGHAQSARKMFSWVMKCATGRKTVSALPVRV